MKTLQTPESNCIVTVSATLTGPGEHILAERRFNAEQAAPSADAAGAVYGLVQASDTDLEQLLAWVQSTLRTSRASNTALESLLRR